MFVTIHADTGEVRWHAAFDPATDDVSDLGKTVSTPLRLIP